MNRLRRLLAALALASVATVCAAGVESPPQRVVSLNLCTDLLLLEIAGPTQIAGLTALARDPALSPYAAAAARLPVTHVQGEALLALAPDLILATPQAAVSTVALLRQLGLRVELLPPPTTVDELRQTLRRIGELLGQTPRAEALIASIDPIAAPPAGSAWLLQAGGHTPGTASLGHALLLQAGLRDLAQHTPYASGGFVPLERLLSARADVLVLSTSTGRANSLAEQFLAHPALAHTSARHVPLDESLWACGSAQFAQGVSRLRAALIAP